MNHRNLCVGLDLSDSITQISCYDDSRDEPVSVGINYDGKTIYEIPTVLGLNISNNLWYYGEEALKKEEEATLICFRNILKMATESETYHVGTYEYNTYELLKNFVSRMLMIIKAKYPYDRIEMITVTVEELNKNISMKLTEILEENNISSDRYRLIDYKKVI